MRVLFVKEIRETVPLPDSVTNASVPSGEIATAFGLVPTVIVLEVAAAMSMMLTEALPRFVTIALVPSGVIATAVGLVPTVTVAATLGVLAAWAGAATTCSVTAPPTIASAAARTRMRL